METTFVTINSILYNINAATLIDVVNERLRIHHEQQIQYIVYASNAAAIAGLTVIDDLIAGADDLWYTNGNTRIHLSKASSLQKKIQAHKGVYNLLVYFSNSINEITFTTETLLDTGYTAMKNDATGSESGDDHKLWVENTATDKLFNFSNIAIIRQLNTTTLRVGLAGNIDQVIHYDAAASLTTDLGNFTTDAEATQERKPTASSVSITGTTTSGQTLTGAYTYADPDSDAEGLSILTWYRADDASGTNKVNVPPLEEEQAIAEWLITGAGGGQDAATADWQITGAGAGQDAATADWQITGAGGGEVVADADWTITGAGATDDTIQALSDAVDLGTYTVQGGDGVNEIATGLAAAINALTGTHGFSASPAAAVVSVTAPVGTGAGANAYVPNTVIVGTVTATDDANFANGVTASEIQALSDAVDLGTYVTVFGDGVNDVATGLAAAIQAGVGTHGFSAAAVTDTVTVTAPIADGDSANAYVPSSVVTVGTVPNTVTEDANFAGGAGTDIGKYTLANEDIGKFIFFEVTPVAVSTTKKVGDTVAATPVGPIASP